MHSSQIRDQISVINYIVQGVSQIYLNNSNHMIEFVNRVNNTKLRNALITDSIKELILGDNGANRYKAARQAYMIIEAYKTGKSVQSLAPEILDITRSFTTNKFSVPPEVERFLFDVIGFNNDDVARIYEYSNDQTDTAFTRMKNRIQQIWKQHGDKCYELVSLVNMEVGLPVTHNVIYELVLSHIIRPGDLHEEHSSCIDPETYFRLMSNLKQRMIDQKVKYSFMSSLYAESVLNGFEYYKEMLCELDDSFYECKDDTELFNQLIKLFQEETSKFSKELLSYDKKYTKQDFLREVYTTEEKYNSMVAELSRKKNIILQGPPGVGKTFAAKRLCYSIMGEKLKDRVEFVQFHQSYSYEDFILGYRPDPNSAGFILKEGSFYRFCKKAQADPSNSYFFIIDEINRGNISKIFGELLMLIEADKRDEEITLAYSEEPFMVPSNVFIIGMMNTADRSISIIDYALRRRFGFIDFYPNFDSPGFKSYLNILNNDKMNSLVRCVSELNEAIRKDIILGEGFMIGHSYLCNCTRITQQWLESVVEYDLIPLLREYWYDEPSKLSSWSLRLRQSIQ